MASSYLWRVYGPGIFRNHFLDPEGRHNLVVAGPDCRFLAYAPVTATDEQRIARELCAWLKDPTLSVPPEAVLSSDLHLEVPRRWMSPGM